MLTCVWNGANFYFDVFSETYTKRLHRYLKDVNKEIKKKGSSNDSESSSAKTAASATPQKGTGIFYVFSNTLSLSSRCS